MLKKKGALMVAGLLAFAPVTMLDDDWSAASAKVSEIASLIRNNYYKDIPAETLEYAPVRGMLETLDPHTYFIDPDTLSRMREDYSGKFYGLGIQIQKQADRLVVVSVVEGTPAWRNGLLVGDIIAEIEGESTRPISSFDAMQKLRGAKGSPVTVTILRDGLPEPFKLTVVREEIPLHSVPYAFMLDETTGYIFIRNFAEGTADELEAKLGELTKQGMRRLLLDLRGNGGGTLAASIEVSDLFLPENTLVVSMKGRNPMYDREFRASKKNPYERLPLIVLINQATASASEIVSGAVMDHDRGLVIGQDSWGKGLVQTVIPLGPSIAVALTTAKYVTPSGRSIQRDYSHIEDYLMAKRAPEAAREVRYTDKGRRVLGQAGITPDYTVQDTLEPLTGRLLIGGSFFTYARKLTGGQTGLAGRYLFPNSPGSAAGKIVVRETFTVDEAVLDDFKTYLGTLGIEFTAKDFEAAQEEIRQELTREIASALWGLNEGLRAYRRTDPVVLKALEVMPEAERFVQGD